MIHSRPKGRIAVASEWNSLSEHCESIQSVTPGRIGDDAARAQVGRILDSPLFLKSKRCRALLRYIVDKTVKGERDDLTERTIGVQVFGRTPDYDTNLDPTVRVAATELRKRLARYYIEVGNDEEPRIEIPVGSYTAKFRFPEQKVAPLDQKPVAPVPVIPVQSRFRYRYAVLPLVAIVLAWAGWQIVRTLLPTSATDKFWAPVLETSRTVLLCVATPPRASSTLSQTSNQQDSVAPGISFEEQMNQHINTVSIRDVAAATNVLVYLQNKGKTPQIRSENGLVLGDLSSHPVVIFGIYNNDWSTRLGANLRFRIRRESEHGKRWIEDSSKPADRSWMVDMSAPAEQVDSDYSLISRVVDQSSGQWWIGITGLTELGTIATQQALIDPKSMAALASGFPKGWARKNLQIVLAVKVDHGGAGTPRVIATNFW